jgi:hypothetical protein
MPTLKSSDPRRQNEQIDRLSSCCLVHRSSPGSHFGRVEGGRWDTRVQPRKVLPQLTALALRHCPAISQLDPRPRARTRRPWCVIGVIWNWMAESYRGIAITLPCITGTAFALSDCRLSSMAIVNLDSRHVVQGMLSQQWPHSTACPVSSPHAIWHPRTANLPNSRTRRHF